MELVMDMVSGAALLQTAAVISAIDQLIATIKPIGWAIAGLGVMLWAISKMLSPVFPDIAGQYQGTISKVAMGALALGIAPTIFAAVQAAMT
jgi:hypothetical protein